MRIRIRKSRRYYGFLLVALGLLMAAVDIWFGVTGRRPWSTLAPQIIGELTVFGGLGIAWFLLNRHLYRTQDLRPQDHTGGHADSTFADKIGVSASPRAAEDTGEE